MHTAQSSSKNSSLPAADDPLSSKVTVELDVPARMRDGVILRSNVYRPVGKGPWPTLLTRTPYGKDFLDVISRLDPVQAARRGFMVVIQDTRGRYTSEGEWQPFRHERRDGYDSVEWAAALEGSSGRVGMYGDSYIGNSQLLAAIEQPPSLAAIAPGLTWSDPMDGAFARGGAVELGFTVSWTLRHGLDYIRKLSLSEAERLQKTKQWLEDFDNLDHGGYLDLPAKNCAILERHKIPDFGGISVLSDECVGEHAKIAGNHHNIAVPSFHVAGWHDMFLQGSLDNYIATARHGRPFLIVGPWTHRVFSDPIGGQLYGLLANRFGAPAHLHGDVGDLQLGWLKHHLGDTSIPLPDKPVRIFVMGRNEWRDEDAWPLSRAKMQRWFLRDGGRLDVGSPTSDEVPTQYVYDPSDPVPTVGGAIMMSFGFGAGPLDQSSIEARKDVCVFTSAPLERELEVIGRVKVVLNVVSSAVGTDWVARLCDVYPDGRSFNLCDGITRVANSAQSLSRIEIDLWSTSNVFLPGHRLRVHVTSSSFPRWDRNMNTGDQNRIHSQSAQQTVFHDSARASLIELPVTG